MYMQAVKEVCFSHFLINYVGIYEVWNRVYEIELRKMTSYFELLTRKFS